MPCEDVNETSDYIKDGVFFPTERLSVLKFALLSRDNYLLYFYSSQQDFTVHRNSCRTKENNLPQTM
jgi:hypothetical protein